MTYYIINDVNELLVKLPDLKQGEAWQVAHIGGDTFEVQIAAVARPAISGFGYWLTTPPVRVREGLNAFFNPIQEIADGADGHPAPWGTPTPSPEELQAAADRFAFKDLPMFKLEPTAATKAGTCEACGEVTTHVPHGLFCRS